MFFNVFDLLGRLKRTRNQHRTGPKSAFEPLLNYASLWMRFHYQFLLFWSPTWGLLGASWGSLGGTFRPKRGGGVKHRRVLLPDAVLNRSKTIPGPSRDPPKTLPGPSQEPQGTLPGPSRDLPGPLQERLSDQSSPQDGPRTPYSHAPNPTRDAKIWRAIHAQ